MSASFGRVVGLLSLAVILSMGTAAQAQQPGPSPRVPNPFQRSGLLSRYYMTPPPGNLPPDKDRDPFFVTRFNDPGNPVKPLDPTTGGIYGLYWKPSCTASFAPYFHGSPGANSITADCKPWHPSLRFFQGIAHPFRPVGHYYSGGSFVPIYDLDPFVIGPGTYPYPDRKSPYHGG